VEIFGVRVDVLEMDEVMAWVSDWMSAGSYKLKTVFTPNVEQVMLARENKGFLEVVNQGDVNVCDSAGLRWAVNRKSGETGLKLQERVAGIDLAEKVCSEAVKSGKKVLLIGGREKVAEKACESLGVRFSGLKIIGIGGPLNAMHEADEEWQQVQRLVAGFQPQVVLVAFGAPSQEQWIVSHADDLGELGVKVAMVVGGAVDVWAGNVTRAPLKWQKNGLEWLWRLLHQPWRLRRQVELLRFVGKVMKEGG
jgi:N-acetylglucosaminyldiphosphoundecaprenol N-acetyl-beta-D-mannosaminyltransferase